MVADLKATGVKGIRLLEDKNSQGLFLLVKQNRGLLVDQYRCLDDHDDVPIDHCSISASLLLYHQLCSSITSFAKKFKTSRPQESKGKGRQ